LVPGDEVGCDKVIVAFHSFLLMDGW